MPVLRAVIPQQKQWNKRNQHTIRARPGAESSPAQLFVLAGRFEDIPAQLGLADRRTNPELLYLQTKWASLIPFAKVADLWKEVLPVAPSTNHKMVREHLQVTAQRKEQELGEERQPNAFESRKRC